MAKRKINNYNYENPLSIQDDVLARYRKQKAMDKAIARARNRLAEEKKVPSPSVVPFFGPRPVYPANTPEQDVRLLLSKPQSKVYSAKAYKKHLEATRFAEKKRLFARKYPRMAKTLEAVENLPKTVESRISTYDTSGVSRAFRRVPGEARQIKRRERAIRGTLAAIGVIGGKQTYKGPGRPRGTYKYGMPIQVYKQQLRQKRAMYEQYQQEQYAKLRPRGYTPEQIQQLQQHQIAQQTAMQELEYPEEETQMTSLPPQEPQSSYPPEAPLPQYPKMKVPTTYSFKGPTPSTAQVDDDLNFQKWSAETTISPRTQRILDTIRRIQNKGKSDNIEMQRRLRERNMVMKSMNLMKAHENMIDVKMDFTGVSGDNILKAPNTFREDPNNFILRRRGFGLLNTREAGNDLRW